MHWRDNSTGTISKAEIIQLFLRFHGHIYLVQGMHTICYLCAVWFMLLNDLLAMNSLVGEPLILIKVQVFYYVLGCVYVIVEYLVVDGMSWWKIRKKWNEMKEREGKEKGREREGKGKKRRTGQGRKTSSCGYFMDGNISLQSSLYAWI